MNTLKETKSILNKYGLKANKRFGQNFLVDDNILNNIVEVSNIKKNEVITKVDTVSEKPVASEKIVLDKVSK